MHHFSPAGPAGALLVAGLLALAACGGGSADTTAPTATVTTNAPAAPNPALIPDGTVITIVFSESMDTTVGTWQLGGDLAGESNGGVWGMTSVQNDTLTVSPSAAWSASPGRILTVDARDLAGNALATLHLSYDVYLGTLYYVDASQPNDFGNGLTPSTARQSLHNAVTDAITPATLLVNAGTYPSGQSLILREGVSLYGGYNADFTQRDPQNQVATIQGTSAGARNDGNRTLLSTIYGTGSTTPITNATVIDGFTILGTTQGSGPSEAVILENAANLTLQNNFIHGGGTGFDDSNAVAITLAAPLIQKNKIHAGNGADASYRFAYGMFLVQSNATVINNEIFGGGSLTSAGSTNGIKLTDASPILRNNTIHGGISDIFPTPPTSYAIYSTGTSHPLVQNNLLMSKGGTYAICYVESGNAQPVTLQNNAFHQCDVMYWDDDNGCMGFAFCETLDQLHAMADVTGGLSGNVIADPQLLDIDGPDDDPSSMTDNDWHLSVSSPASITAGGLNGIDTGWSFSTDKDGMTRPASGTPWAIGAYELDPLNPAHSVNSSACASSGCHDGATPGITGKSLTHADTTDACEVCHVTTAWVPAITPFDHNQVITPDCADCHDGSKPDISSKSLTHPGTTDLCQACHLTSSWTTLLIPTDHSQVLTPVCADCHDGTIATGKHAAHVGTSLDCGACHSTTGWIPTL